MANSFRGEVDIVVAGAKYPCALTLDALARLGDALKIDTIAALEQRIPEFRLSDMRPVLTALLEANGHKVPPDAVGRVSFRAYSRAIAAIWAAKPLDDGEDATTEDKTQDPPKRGE